MADNKKLRAESSWYESNLLWGPLALASGIILTVIAATKQDLRWLVWLAWPCFGVAIWWLARRTREVLLTSILGIVVAGALLVWLSHWLRAEQVASGSSLPTQPHQGIPTIPTIDQHAKDSDCSNVVAGRDANIDCSSSEKAHDHKQAPNKH